MLHAEKHLVVVVVHVAELHDKGVWQLRNEREGILLALHSSYCMLIRAYPRAREAFDGGELGITSAVREKDGGEVA